MWGNNAFAFDLYRVLSDGEGNLFYSPFSISQALAMTSAGAKGETLRQMEATLHPQASAKWPASRVQRTGPDPCVARPGAPGHSQQRR